MYHLPKPSMLGAIALALLMLIHPAISCAPPQTTAVHTGNPVLFGSSLPSYSHFELDCSTLEGWIAQEEDTEFLSPLPVIIEGELTLFHGGLCYANLPDPWPRDNVGPLSIRSIDLSIPQTSLLLLVVTFDYDYGLGSNGGIRLHLFDQNREVVASLYLTDTSDERDITGSVSYYLPGERQPCATFEHTTDSINPSFEISLMYIAGTGAFAARVSMGTDRSGVLVGAEETALDRRIEYLGVQAHCMAGGVFGDAYRLSGVEITYASATSVLTDPVTTTNSTGATGDEVPGEDMSVYWAIRGLAFGISSGSLVVILFVFVRLAQFRSQGRLRRP